MADNVIPMNSARATPKDGPVELKTTAALLEDARRCQREHAIGLVIGAAGVGKSTAWRILQDSDSARATRAADALAALQSQSDAALMRGLDRLEGRSSPTPCLEAPTPSNDEGPARPLVFVVTANRTMTTPTKILGEVQKALGADAARKGFHSPPERFDAVVNTLRRLQPLKPDQMGPLLIIDEAQNLDVDQLDTLRSIWDVRLGPHREGSCGLLLSGNPKFAKSLSRAATEADFAQLTSRIGIRRTIDGPSRSDVLGLCVHLGIGDASAQDYLCQIATRPGALRSVVNVVKNARAAAGDKRLSAAVLRDAWADIEP